MRSAPPTFSIPASALDELDMVESADFWVSATELVDWVNDVVNRFLPEDDKGGSGRVSQELSVRTLRYYQTLGCIDTPSKEAREARYGFRHYLQALLVRKLVWQRVPVEQVTSLLQGRTTEEYKKLLLEGIEITARPGGAQIAKASDPGPSQEPQTWRRITLAPGIEVHLHDELSPIKSSDLPDFLSGLEGVIKAHSQPKQGKRKS